MESFTRKLWAKQDQHEGDRWRLFTAIAESVAAENVLYAGSFVDIAPSFVWPSVTYVDLDRRVPRFFADVQGVQEIIERHRAGATDARVQFIAGDYSEDLGLADETFDLLISLYAGFISEHCTRYLRVGGTLLVNPSHGDAAMASIDDRYELRGVVESRAGDYRVRDENLETYLIPKKPTTVTREELHQAGRGIGYTKSPFAYLFERTS